MSNPAKPMPNRERFLAICRGERPGDVPIMDWFHEPLVETPGEWIKQGAPEEIDSREAFNRYFQIEHVNDLPPIVVPLLTSLP